MNNPRPFFLAIGLSTLLSPLSGIAAPSETEALLLEEIRALRASIEQMESRLAAVEEQVATVAVSSVPMAASAATSADNATFMERVAAAVQLRDQRVMYPWMDSGLWSGVRGGMSPDEVVAILGEPTLEDPSLHKRVDTVYTYRGRNPATGQLVVGKVKFYRSKVVEVEAP